MSEMTNKLAPCKHLDYNEETYGGCGVIETCAPPFENVRYWARNPAITEGGYPRNVQFCGQGRGRINSISQCYEAPGPMSCYEPGEPDE